MTSVNRCLCSASEAHSRGGVQSCPRHFLDLPGRTAASAGIAGVKHGRSVRRCDADKITATVGAAPAQHCMASLGPAGPQTISTNGELTERFQREAIPLLESLYRRAVRMTRDHADAEDLLQDTLLNAYAGFCSLREGTNVNAWLHRVLTNAYIDSYRKKQRQPQQCPTEQITDRQLAANADHSAAGLRSAEDQALLMLPDSAIAAAMWALPEQLRMSVYYADVEGFRYDEIAQTMSTRTGTVKSRLHRGRCQLRHLLRRYDRTNGSSC